MQRAEAALKKEGSRDARQKTLFAGSVGWVFGIIGDYAVQISCVAPSSDYIQVNFSAAGSDSMTVTNLVKSLRSTVGNGLQR
jgi:hypothetical protein